MKIINKNIEESLKLIERLRKVICGPGCGPIYLLKVQTQNWQGPDQEYPYAFFPKDVNEGAKGAFMYIGYSKKERNEEGQPPIIDVKIGEYNDKLTKIPDELLGYEWDPTDLNMGAGGKFIYMFWKRGPKGSSNGITNFMLLSNNNSIPDYIAGYDVVVTPDTKPGSGCPPLGTPADLNAGAGGKFIWMYVSDYICPVKNQGWVIPDTDPNGNPLTLTDI